MSGTKCSIYGVIHFNRIKSLISGYSFHCLCVIQGAVEGVAARSRRRRSLDNSSASSEDLLGRSLELAGELGLVSPDGLASLPQSVLNFLSRQTMTQKKKFRSKKVARMIQRKQSK